MKPSEAPAQRIVEAVESPGRMVYREDQSARTYDFDLHRSAGAFAAVEVTSITDGDVKATHAAINRWHRIPRRLCTKDWRIHPGSDANIKRIFEKADAYLADIEATGVERFFSSRNAAESPHIAAIWRDLRVQGGRVLQRKEPEIVIALPVTGGPYGLSLVLAAMERVASANDNLEKLAKSGAAERHLVIYVDRSATSVLMGLRDFQPPTEPPDLPAEVTDVWMFSETYGEDRYVVWRGGERRPWQRLLLADVAGDGRLVLVEESDIAVSNDHREESQARGWMPETQ